MSTFSDSKNLFNQYHFSIIEIDLPIVEGDTDLASAIQSASPQWYWKLNELSGVVAVDEMQNGNLEYESSANTVDYSILSSRSDGIGAAKAILGNSALQIYDPVEANVVSGPPFSMDLWTGTGASQTVSNSVDFTAKAALLLRVRTPVGNFWEVGIQVFETVSGKDEYHNLSLDGSGAITQTAAFVSFDSGGYTLGNSTLTNKLSTDYIGWSFQAAASFFDVVSWVGDGVAGKTISHALGLEVGMIIIPVQGGSVYHRSMPFPQTRHMFTRDLANASSGINWWNNTMPTTTEFSVGDNVETNALGNNYTALVFAHDPSADGVIYCGEYTGNGTAVNDITDTGWTPQFLLIKQHSGIGTEDWYIFDTTRGLLSSGNDAYVKISGLGVEVNTADHLDLLSNGFTLKNSILVNESGNEYIYMAIRAGENIVAPVEIIAILNNTVNNPNGSVNLPVGDKFGWSSATDGNNTIIGASKEDQFGNNSGAAYIYNMTGVLQFTINPPVPVLDGDFGYSVALSGDNVVVGGLKGLSYIFSASTGLQLFSLTPASSASGDSFGESIAVDPSYVAVGAPAVDDSNVNSGEVSVFDVTTGILFRTIVNPISETSSRFGESVAISGDNLIISASGYNGGVGRAYIYSIASGAQLFILSNPASTDFSSFGNRVAADGNLVVIGSSDYSVIENKGGRVHVFNITTGAQLLTIANPHPQGGDYFGASVAIENNTIAVGSRGDSSSVASAGAVFLFEADTGDLITSIYNPISDGSGSGFGSSVAVNGVKLIVGSPESDNVASNSGTYYGYTLV